MANQPESIAESMAAIRRRGTGAATELKHEITRLTDWREHVKANPLPFVVTALSIGYFLIPSRAKVADPAGSSVPQAGIPPSVQLNRSSTFSDRLSNSIRSHVTTMAGRWISATVSKFVAQQIENLKEHHDDHGPTPQQSGIPLEPSVRE